MISVNSTLFFAIVQLAGVLSLACGFLFWKSRRVARKLRQIEANWAEARVGVEATIAALEAGQGEQAARRIAGLKVLQLIFGAEPVTGSAAWRSASADVVALVTGTDAASTLTAGRDKNPAEQLEDADEEENEDERLRELLQTDTDVDAAEGDEAAQEAATDFGEVETLVEEQNRQLCELSQYRNTVLDLSAKLQRLSSANHKLLDYLRTVSASDGKLSALRQMVEKMHASGQEMLVTVNELDQEKVQLEPRIRALNEHNAQLLASLRRHKQQLGQAILERVELRERLADLENRIAMRKKSFDRLHKKFEALRREYLALYDRSSKAGQLVKPS